MSCSEKHLEGTSHWHIDKTLCAEWLRNLERGKFTSRHCDTIRALIHQESIFHFQRLDYGQMITLDVSLSLALVRPRGIRAWAASVGLGPLKGGLKVERDNQLPDYTNRDSG